MKDSKRDESKVFVPEERVLETVSGEKIKVPRVNWKKQILISRLIGSTIESLECLRNRDLSNLQVKDMIEVLPEIIEKAPEKVTEMCAILLEKDNSFVENELDLERIVELLRPFFASILRKLSSMLGSQNVQELLSKKQNSQI